MRIGKSAKHRSVIALNATHSIRRNEAGPRLHQRVLTRLDKPADLLGRRAHAPSFDLRVPDLLGGNTEAHNNDNGLNVQDDLDDGNPIEKPRLCSRFRLSHDAQQEDDNGKLSEHGAQNGKVWGNGGVLHG